MVYFLQLYAPVRARARSFFEETQHITRLLLFDKDEPKLFCVIVKIAKTYCPTI